MQVAIDEVGYPRMIAAVVGGGHRQVRAAAQRRLLPDRRQPHLRDRRVQPGRDAAVRPVRDAAVRRTPTASATRSRAGSAARPTSSTATTSTSRSSAAARNLPMSVADARRGHAGQPDGPGRRADAGLPDHRRGLTRSGSSRRPRGGGLTSRRPVDARARASGRYRVPHAIRPHQPRPVRPHAHRDGHPLHRRMARWTSTGVARWPTTSSTRATTGWSSTARRGRRPPCGTPRRSPSLQGRSSTRSATGRTIVGGAGNNDTRHSIEIARAAQDAGAHGLLLRHAVLQQAAAGGHRGALPGDRGQPPTCRS